MRSDNPNNASVHLPAVAGHNPADNGSLDNYSERAIDVPPGFGTRTKAANAGEKACVFDLLFGLF